LEIELAPLKKMSKKIVIAKKVNSGQAITREDLEFRSPGDGVSPAELHLVVNKVAVRDLEIGHSLSLDDFSA